MFGISQLYGSLIGVALLAIASFGAGVKVEGWRWSAAELKATKQAETRYIAEVAKDASAETHAQEKINVLNSALATTRKKLAALPRGGACLEPDSLRVLNDAIRGSAAD